MFIRGQFVLIPALTIAAFASDPNPKQAHIQGEVKIQFDINPNGKADNLTAEDTAFHFELTTTAPRLYVSLCTNRVSSALPG